MAISVTITGSGNATNCYAQIGGKTYSSAASGLTVNAGDTITFRANARTSKVTVDGTSIGASATWTVPSGIASIEIQLSYSQSSATITVTTTEAVLHKVLVGGTGYGIASGRALVGGTGYSVEAGRTLVNGTGYDV